MKQRNPEVRGLIAGVALAGIGAALIALPALLKMDGMRGGYALMFVGLFVVVLGAVTAAVFGQRAARLRGILAGQGVLAHWTYSPSEAERQAARDLARTRALNRGRLAVVAGLMVACTALFAIAGLLSGQAENMGWFVGGMLGVLLLVAAAALGMPYVEFRRAMHSTHEATIAEKALYVNGALHSWEPPLGALDGVSLVDEGGEARLVFCLRARGQGGVGGDRYVVEVPVPPGEIETARRVEARLTRAR